jgi:hypothetical protein
MDQQLYSIEELTFANTFDGDGFDFDDVLMIDDDRCGTSSCDKSISDISSSKQLILSVGIKLLNFNPFCLKCD